VYRYSNEGKRTRQKDKGGGYFTAHRAGFMILVRLSLQIAAAGFRLRSTNGCMKRIVGRFHDTRIPSPYLLPQAEVANARSNKRWLSGAETTSPKQTLERGSHDTRPPPLCFCVLRQRLSGLFKPARPSRSGFMILRHLWARRRAAPTRRPRQARAGAR
jgi:hypothetical protein